MTPTLLQFESAECGVVCLAMVLARFGQDVELDAVRAACRGGRDGVSAAALVEAGERFGLICEAQRVELDGLTAMSMPLVLFWGFDHFVVLDRVARDGYVINDPALGRRRIGRAEMSRFFTGIALAFRPGPGFRSARRRSRSLPRLLSVLREARGAAIAVLVSGVLGTALGILVPGLTRIYIDDYLGAAQRSWLVPLLLGMVVLMAARGTIAWISARVTLHLQTAVSAVLSSRIVWGVLRLPWSFVTSRSAGELATRTQIAGQIAGTVSGPVLGLATNGIAVIGYGAAMLAYSPMLTAAVLVITVANALVLAGMNRALVETHGVAQMLAGRAHAANIRGVAMLEESRAAGTAGLLFGRMLNGYVDEVNAENRAAQLGQRSAAVAFFSSRLLLLVVLGLGAVEVMRSDLTIGALLAFQMLADQFAQPLGALLPLGSAVSSAAGGLERAHDLLNASPEQSNDDQAFAEGRLRGDVDIEALRFGHSGCPPLLDGLTARFEAGRMTLLVMPSGAGKTTLAMLLAGLLRPLGGEVRIDGRAVTQIPAGVLRYSIGIAETTPFLPAGPLRDALSFWDPGIGVERLQDALRAADADEFVDARAGGLASRIGEDGAGFSGGEKQRLGIARALALAPAVLLLDDATTALDEASEVRVLTNLRTLGITVIMLSSEPRCAELFDSVLVLGEGRLMPAATPVQPVAAG